MLFPSELEVSKLHKTVPRLRSGCFLGVGEQVDIEQRSGEGGTPIP